MPRSASATLKLIEMVRLSVVPTALAEKLADAAACALLGFKAIKSRGSRMMNALCLNRDNNFVMTNS